MRDQIKDAFSSYEEKYPHDISVRIVLMIPVYFFKQEDILSYFLLKQFEIVFLK